MPNFKRLPYDIQRHILSFILSNRDVAAMSRQSRDLHSLCDMKTREKYHQARISHNNLDHAFDMLMDILRRPSLGQYVRHIDCRASPTAYKEYVESGCERQLNDEDKQLLQSAARRAGLTASKEGQIMNMLLRKTAFDPMRDSYSSNSDMSGAFVPQALAALLVSVSPNLESMTLSPPYFNFTGYYWPESRKQDITSIVFPLEQLLRETNSNPNDKPWLQNLRKVYLVNEPRGTWDDDRFYHSMDFQGCLVLFDQLPSIELVGTDLLEEDENGYPSLGHAISNVSRFAINHASLSAAYLAVVISSCKTLREFRFSIGGRATNDGGYPTFSPKTFIKAILMHRETLEVLDLDIDAHIIGFAEGADEETTEHDFENYDCREEIELSEGPPPEALWTQAGSLKDLRALKRLSLGIGFLMYLAKGVRSTNGFFSREFMLVDELPEGLEYLCIRGYEKGRNPDHDKQIDALRSLLQKGSSTLKTVEGIDKLIPHAEDVDDPDNNTHLLWNPEVTQSDESDLDDSESENSN
ncbi:hypothetical protein BO71DRAFT_385849 [Aspergillus ellipticus CBS 707.79]|uniref:F-box domain-containing protein n=1 Tax=Aspergillus ellipticus CBS 707.79 TaxID=1448320 RepID=A0A319D252_9EURO|nr:hypothetical protein BO71DRAFT_385849 [Aspergillus ellipticus CBS 707.79]